MMQTDMKNRASRSAESREKNRREREAGLLKKANKPAIKKNARSPIVQRGAVMQHRQLTGDELTMTDRFHYAFGAFLKCMLVASIASVVGVSIYFGKSFLEEASSRPVNTMVVQGNFTFLTQKQVSEMVMPMIENGFLRLPLSGIKDSLEQNPWIDTASVSRRWPDKLAVSVVEQQPIARWGSKGFLNQRGELIELVNNELLIGLPKLSGNKGQEKLIMQDYQQLAQLLRSFGLIISEFHCDELMSRSVVLSNDLIVNIGRDQLTEKIQRFLTVYNASLKTQLNEVATIDLRYGNGVAVEWKEVVVEQPAVELKKNGKA